MAKKIPKIEIIKINASTFQLDKISSTTIRNLMDKFSYLPPGYKFNPRFRLLGIKGVKVSLIKADGTFPSGMIDDVLLFLEKNEKPYKIDPAIKEHMLPLTDFFEKGLSNAIFDNYEFSPGNPVLLRDYQLNAVKAAFDDRYGLLNLSTGAGKCLTGDTKVKVQLPKELIVKYKDLINSKLM